MLICVVIVVMLFVASVVDVTFVVTICVSVDTSISGGKRNAVIVAILK